MTRKIVPERAGLAAVHTRDVYYAYDLRGLQTGARFDGPDGEGVAIWYDGFGRPATTLVAMGGHYRYLENGYDAGGNRTGLAFVNPGYVQFGFAYDGLGRMVQAHEHRPAPSADDLIVRYWYDPAGNRSGIVRGAGAGGFTTVYHRDPVERPTVIANDLPAPGGDVAIELGYNPASQIVSRSVSNDSYAAPPSVNTGRGYQVNGLNQYTGTTWGGAPNWSFEYDPNGNLTRSVDPVGPLTTNYLYDVENRLVSASGYANAALVYDPLGRLFQITNAAGAKTQFLHDGDDLVAEYDGSGNLTKRYVHGPGTDDPVAVYDGPDRGLGNRRYMLPDERGSIAALVNANGTPSVINRYDAWGVPGAGNAGRFQYTGQIWIAELGLYHYKSRLYSPWLGRFLQVDPIGYEDQINLYAYVGNDPTNWTDPTGECQTTGNKDGTVTYTGVCGTSQKAAEYIEARMNDDNSRIAQTDTNAIARTRLISFTIGEKDPYGEEVDSAVAKEDKNGTISVVIDPADRALVDGRDAVTGMKVKDYELSMDEIAEHEIAGHANDMVNHVKGSQGAIRAENAYRQRRGERFQRIGHGGKVIPGN